MAKADRIVSFILPGLLFSLDTRSETHDKSGTICSRGDHIFCYGQSGGTDFAGDHPRRDSTAKSSQSPQEQVSWLCVCGGID